MYVYTELLPAITFLTSCTRKHRLPTSQQSRIDMERGVRVKRTHNQINSADAFTDARIRIRRSKLRHAYTIYLSIQCTIISNVATFTTQTADLIEQRVHDCVRENVLTK